MARSRSSTPSEGEIVESDSEKATKPQPSTNGKNVDRPSRKLDPSSQPPSRRSPTSKDSRSRSRSRSPFRKQRGSKRTREDDHYHRHERDDRRKFRVHYEDRNSDRFEPYRGSKDRPRKQKSQRTLSNSRSPPRFSHEKDGARQNGGRRDERPSTKKQLKGWQGEAYSREQSVSRDGRAQDLATSSSRTEMPENMRQSTPKILLSAGSQYTDTTIRQSEDSSPTAIDEEPLDEAVLIEQRRKRREAIKAKYRNQASPMMMQALNISAQQSPSSSNTATPSAALEPQVPRSSSSQASLDSSRQGSPALLEISNDIELANNSNLDDAAREEDEPSAADYNPTVDMQEDKVREETHANDADVPATAYDETNTGRQDILLPDQTSRSKESVDDGDFDMFAEQGDDLFAEEQNTNTIATGIGKPSKAVPLPKSKALDMSMLDDFDDPEGYYKIILGELLDGRYQVQLNLGRGMFSAVVRALDQTSQRVVAIKIIRNNETMRKAAAKEIEILETLNQADTEDKKHIIRLERSFEHKGHLCMVFENLSINLREVLKKFGRDVGINLQAVRAYAQQMFLGLSLLRKCNILHADLKPDNVLVNDGRNKLKICDLGSASDASENEITPYLVSRFYRAPEIILGMPFDFAIDTWSIGCTLFELYTGKILFTGRSNNQMLRAIMECRGRFSHKFLRRSQLAALHFDENGDFRSLERDKATGRDMVRILTLAKPIRDLRQRVLATGSRGSANATSDARELNLFIDLLDKCLALNPERRCTPSEALKHPFIARTKA